MDPLKPRTIAEIRRYDIALRDLLDIADETSRTIADTLRHADLKPGEFEALKQVRYDLIGAIRQFRPSYGDGVPA